MTKNDFCIVIPHKIINDMFKYVEEGLPREVCGILSGKGNKVTKFYKMENIDNSVNSYFMNPEEQFETLKKIQSDKQEMLAIFHSHPASPPVLSEKDMELAFYSECVYLIISHSGGMPQAAGEKQEIKGYRIIDEAIKEVRILYE